MCLFLFNILLYMQKEQTLAWMNIPSVEVGHNISSRELGLDKRFAGSKNACNNEVQARTILRIYGLKQSMSMS